MHVNKEILQMRALFTSLNAKKRSLKVKILPRFEDSHSQLALTIYEFSRC